MTHPNASIAVLTGAAATCIVYVATHLGLEMSAEVGMAFATLLIAAVLFAGRRSASD